MMVICTAKEKLFLVSSFSSLDSGHCTLHITAAQATSANIQLHRTAFDDHANLLNIRSPSMAGFPIGMAHIVADHLTLRAYFTILAHLT